MSFRSIWATCLVPLLSLSLVHGADLQDVDDELPQGIAAIYRSGEVSIPRTEQAFAFSWGTNVPDQRLPSGKFSATWETEILIRMAGAYRFHAFVQGKAEVRVNGQAVLRADVSEPTWVSGEVTKLGFGEQELAADFERTGDTARFQLFWSSDSFPLEPIPVQALFLPDEERADAMYETGRVAFTTHRCNRCHVREQDPPAQPGPALTSLGSGTDPEWIVRWLKDPHAVDRHARMPNLGLTSAQAEAIAAALCAEPVATLKTIETPKRAEQFRDGEILFRSLGCLACHTKGDLGEAGPFGGSDLTHVSAKRSEAWIAAWLESPATLNADHRMPVFALSKAENTQLAIYLSGLERKGTQTQKTSGPDQVAAGRKLIDSLGCVACHQIPGQRELTTKLTDLSQPVKVWEDSCLAVDPNPAKARPAFPGIHVEAVKTFLAARTGHLSPESASSAGVRILEWKNCLACHPRGLTRGLATRGAKIAAHDPGLEGQSEALIPPSLNGIGDKLPEESLAAAIAGKQPRRLPWLRVRMPVFRNSDAEVTAIREFFLAQDRIPENAPGVQLSPDPDPAETLLAGHTLVGGKGFSCVACHQFGKFQPRNVALGTRGSDLLMLGKRMRPEFFRRWTRAPLRIVPDMEMPSYDKAVPHLLGGDLDRQLAAIWSSLNDPEFQVPLDPSVVEQNWSVAEGSPARVVRDVFTLPGQDRNQFVARSFAVGFENQHNLLFDLDRLSVRAWWLGDFAQQRTQGKSWYWDMAGVSIAEGLGQEFDFALHRKGTDDLVAWPQMRDGRAGRLENYAPEGLGIRLKYELYFAEGIASLPVLIEETWTPVSRENEPSGWQRSVLATGVPAGFDLLVRLPSLARTLGNVEIASVSPMAAAEVVPIGEKATSRFFRLTPEKGKSAALVDYLCDAPAVRVPVRESPVVALTPEPVTVVPGYTGMRLPIDRSIMPTALTWTNDGVLAFTSLKGHVYLAHDTDGDGVEDRLTLFEEGLAAPYGILADGADLIVAHKPELLRLRDTDGDGRADRRDVIASGWGYNDNYHDWTCGIVKDSHGRMYVGLGSDYAQSGRVESTRKWRGRVLRIDTNGTVSPIASGFRYPTGLALAPDDRLFVTDNQGVQNTFNEINEITDGGFYGVPSLGEKPTTSETRPAIQVPHPWTRSVNGIFFLNPESVKNGIRDVFEPFAGQGIGCEYDTHFLIRFSLERVGSRAQGAAYPFSLPTAERGTENFEGALSGATSPRGEIYIGSIHDSGWLGGLNVGSIVRLKRTGAMPMGIREINALPNGFDIHFTSKLDPLRAGKPDAYTVSGYTRRWQGSYGTPDSDRHQVPVTKVTVSPDGKSVQLDVERLRAGFVYEVSCGKIGAGDQDLWPNIGYYTMNQIPEQDVAK